jgi:hypothetical protein
MNGPAAVQIAPMIADCVFAHALPALAAHVVVNFDTGDVTGALLNAYTDVAVSAAGCFDRVNDKFKAHIAACLRVRMRERGAIFVRGLNYGNIERVRAWLSLQVLESRAPSSTAALPLVQAILAWQPSVAVGVIEVEAASAVAARLSDTSVVVARKLVHLTTSLRASSRVRRRTLAHRTEMACTRRNAKLVHVRVQIQDLADAEFDVACATYKSSAKARLP